MKNVLFFLLVLLLCSCKGDFEVISSKKITVIPGVKTAKKYIKYHIQLKNQSVKTKKIDSIILIEKEKCYSVNFTLKKEGSPKQLNKVVTLGLYTISASFIEGNYKETKCTSHKNGLVIYYKEGEQQKQFRLHSFVEERKTMR